MASERPLQRDMFSGEWVENALPKSRPPVPVENAQQRSWLGESGVECAQSSAVTRADPAAISDHLSREADVFDASFDSALNRDGLDVTEVRAVSEEERNPRAPEAVYLEIVAFAEEIAATLWIDPLYEHRYQTALEATLLEARRMGLSDEEIQLAILLGEYRGKRRFEDEPYP